MPPQNDTQYACSPKNNGGSAKHASRSFPVEQRIGGSNVFIGVVLTVTLAAAAAIVVLTFIYWIPQVRWDSSSGERKPEVYPFQRQARHPYCNIPIFPLRVHPPLPPGNPNQGGNLDPNRNPNQGGNPNPPEDPNQGGNLDPHRNSNPGRNPNPYGNPNPLGNADIGNPGSSSNSSGGRKTPTHTASPPAASRLSGAGSPSQEPASQRRTPKKRPKGRVMTPHEKPPTNYVQSYQSEHYPGLRVLLHGPSPTDPSGKTALYETNPQRNFCSVTACTSDLAVAGPLAELLVNTVRDTSHYLSLQDLNAVITQAHRAAATQARQFPTTLVETTLQDHPVYRKLFAYTRGPAVWEEREFGRHASLVILGVFREPFYPHGHPANRFHLYAIPPNESRQSGFFVRAYRTTYRNCLTIVSLYNNKYPEDQIEHLRVSLLRHGAGTDMDVALAGVAVSTMLLQASQKPFDFVLDLPWDQTNSFFYQVRSHFTAKSQAADRGRRSPRTLGKDPSKP